MGDVFISYASEDKETAQRIATALTHHRHTVWWDRNIPPGRAYDQVIQEALAAAKCVVVLWSASSIGSDWVKAEADEAAKRRILVPVLIADVAPPFEFRRIQAAHLVDWDGALDHPELQKLVAAVARVLGQPHEPLRHPTHEPGGRSRSKLAVWGAAATGIALLAGGAVWQLANLTTNDQIQARADDPITPPHVTTTAVASRPTSLPVRTSVPEPTALPTPGDKSTGGALGGGHTPSPATLATGQIDLLAADNGGQLIVASHPDWAKLIDGSDASYAYVKGTEGVFAFRDERPATFDSVAVFIPATSGENVKDFELLAGSESPTGQFDSIGTFTTQNIRFFKSPYQSFTFPPVTARYVKLKPINPFNGGRWLAIHEIRLYGRLH